MKQIDKIIKALVCGYLLVAAARAQNYRLDWFTLSGAFLQNGGDYTLTAWLSGNENVTMSGGSFVIEPGFETTSATSPVPEEIIFDNSQGAAGGFESVSGNTWVANKFCVSSNSFDLRSITLILGTRDPSSHPVVRLQVYSNDAKTGKPLSNISPVLNLSGATNPITFKLSPTGDSYETPLTWIPSSPMKLAGDHCYWAVLNVESSEALYAVTTALPLGDAAALGRAASPDAGFTWNAPDPTSNRKMVIRAALLGAPEPESEGPRITRFQTLGDKLLLTLRTRTGKTYRIQKQDALGMPNWSEADLAVIPGIDGTLDLVLKEGPAKRQQFFRAVEEP